MKVVRLYPHPTKLGFAKLRRANRHSGRSEESPGLHIYGSTILRVRGQLLNGANRHSERSEGLLVVKLLSTSIFFLFSLFFDITLIKNAMKSLGRFILLFITILALYA